MAEILSFFGWSFLPDFVTSNLQSFYYSLTIRAGEPKPAPGSATHARHRRRIYIFVIVIYLAYTLYEADWQIRRVGDFYQDLGVPYDAVEKTVSSKFRRLTLLHHPDKLPPNTPPNVAAATQARYIHLTTARDVLTSSVRRHAYDRFGPAVADSASAISKCKTTKEFTLQGIKQLAPLYVASIAGMWIFTWMGLLDQDGVYWRFWALAAMFCTEWHAITRTWPTAVTLVPTLFNPWLRALASTFNAARDSLPAALLNLLGIGGVSDAWASTVLRQPYLPFQALQVAHKALLAFFIALSRLGPVLEIELSGKPADANGKATIERELARLEQAVAHNNVESARLLALEVAAFCEQDQRDGTDIGLSRLRPKIASWFVDNALRSEAGVRVAMERALARRNQDVSGGEIHE